jgi:hypothetical protein
LCEHVRGSRKQTRRMICWSMRCCMRLSSGKGPRSHGARAYTTTERVHRTERVHTHTHTHTPHTCTTHTCTCTCTHTRTHTTAGGALAAGRRPARHCSNSNCMARMCPLSRPCSRPRASCDTQIERERERARERERERERSGDACGQACMHAFRVLQRASHAPASRQSRRAQAAAPRSAHRSELA